ncbi:MAG: hypothetical protein V4565_05070 [Bacteroidota bacterium]
MPLITVPFISDSGKVDYFICGCTNEEQEKFMNRTDEINSHYIPTSFFTKYITDLHRTIDEVDKFTEYAVEELNGFKYTWKGSNVLTLVMVRKVLHGYDLSFDEFIDAYASYLKSVNF